MPGLDATLTVLDGVAEAGNDWVGEICRLGVAGVDTDGEVTEAAGVETGGVACVVAGWDAGGDVVVTAGVETGVVAAGVGVVYDEQAATMISKAATMISMNNNLPDLSEVSFIIDLLVLDYSG